MRYRSRTDGGWTLIELMAVVAIMGAFAAIAIPKFAGMVRKARDGQAKARLGQFRASIDMYRVEHRLRVPEQITGAGYWQQSPNLTAAVTPYFITGLPELPQLNDIVTNPGDVYNCLHTSTNTLGGHAGGAGWEYARPLGSVFINLQITDASGVMYTTY